MSNYLQALFFAVILLLSSSAYLSLENPIADASVLVCLPSSTAEKFNDTDIIFSGKVTEIVNTISMAYVKFDVLNKWKGISSNAITIAGSASAGEADGGPEFHVGDNYLVYATNNHGYLETSCWGEPLASAKDEINVLKAIVSNPRQQIAHGVMPDNVLCSDELVLIKKLSANSVACVKPDTAKKLAERGWGVLNEQTAWFEYHPVECRQMTPWERHFAASATQLSESYFIRAYFESQGITIFEIETTYLPNGLPQPLCGNPADYTLFFLVLQSDVNKMTELGYKLAKVPLPSHAHIMS